MTNDIRLEIEDTESGVELTAAPSAAGVSLTLEDDDAAVTIDLDAHHAQTLMYVIDRALSGRSILTNQIPYSSLGYPSSAVGEVQANYLGGDLDTAWEG